MTYYFIRMILLWLVLIARCSGSDEISLDGGEAEQSSTADSTRTAAKAVDYDLNTPSCTKEEDPAWFRVYFTIILDMYTFAGSR